MWGIRILSGPQAGQTFALRAGKNIVGRAGESDIKLVSNGVSKEHAEILVLNDKVVLKDMSSRNGTFLNGVKVQNGLIRLGDKASLHDVLFDIVPMTQLRTPVQAPQHTMQESMPAYHPQAPHPHMHAQTAPPHMSRPQESIFKVLENRILDYMETVALPGIYRLPEVIDFKWVVASFILIFILSVTVLSVIPMSRITAESIEAESRRRALTIARNLAAVNQQALLQGTESALNVDSARIEEGVKTAMIVAQADGSILAPAEAAGRTPEYSFIAVARRGSGESLAEVDSSTLGATVPISYFDSEIGSVSVKAHAIVIYDKGSLALDSGRTLSLFIQTLVIALILGYFLFYCLFKLMERPLVLLNQELDLALREKRESTQLEFKFGAFQDLISNINSLLSRSAHASHDQQSHQSGSKETEAENIIQLISYPSLAINRDHLIISCNQSFEAMTNVPNSQLRNTALSALPELSLHQKLTALVQRASQNPLQIAHEDYQFSGENFLLSCQAVMSGNELSYYIVSIGASAQADGSAA